MPKPVRWLITIGLVLLLLACGEPETPASRDHLRIAVLPDQGIESLRQRYAPLCEFMQRETRFSCELIVPSDYSDLLARFGKGEVDLAYFGGVTFVKAQAAHGAVPLVMRDVDSRFTSVLMVPAGSGVKTLQDLEGKRFSFGSSLSTSGHLMPRYFLAREHGIRPEAYFGEVRYSGRHDRTAYWVRDGEVDGGVANAEIVRKMLLDERLGKRDIRVIWTTPPYADYVWAAHPKLAEGQRERIREAFLKLSSDDPSHVPVLASLGAGVFYPASSKDFATLKMIVDRQADEHP